MRFRLAIAIWLIPLAAVQGCATQSDASRAAEQAVAESEDAATCREQKAATRKPMRPAAKLWSRHGLERAAIQERRPAISTACSGPAPTAETVTSAAGSAYDDDQSSPARTGSAKIALTSRLVQKEAMREAKFTVIAARSARFPRQSLGTGRGRNLSASDVKGKGKDIATATTWAQADLAVKAAVLGGKVTQTSTNCTPGRRKRLQDLGGGLPSVAPAGRTGFSSQPRLPKGRRASDLDR